MQARDVKSAKGLNVISLVCHFVSEWDRKFGLNYVYVVCCALKRFCSNVVKEYHESTLRKKILKKNTYSEWEPRPLVGKEQNQKSAFDFTAANQRQRIDLMLNMSRPPFIPRNSDGGIKIQVRRSYDTFTVIISCCKVHVCREWRRTWVRYHLLYRTEHLRWTARMKSKHLYVSLCQ